MRNLILVLTMSIQLFAFAQKRQLSYSRSENLLFLNKEGDTLSRALLGGFNQPQFQTIDLNNDGLKDLVVHDRTGFMLFPFINQGNPDIRTFRYDPRYTAAFPKMENTWFLLVDYDQDGKEDLWTKINFKTVLFRNVTRPSDKRVQFLQTSEYLVAYNFNPPPFPDSSIISCGNFNIPTIADVDQDGDVDIFSYQADEGNLLLYRNMTKDFNLPLHPPVFDLADFCWGDFVDTAYDGIRLKGCPFKIYRKHGGGSTLLWFDNDNDGDLDLLMGNAGGKNVIFMKNGKKEFNLAIDSIIAYDGHWPAKDVPVSMNSFPGLFSVDADGDGLKDILVAPNQFEKVYKIEQTGQIWFYKNYGTASVPDYKLESKDFFTNQMLDHGAYTAPVLYDIDNDKDLDLLIATNGDNAKTGDLNYRIVYYENQGTQTQSVFRLKDEDLWGLSRDSLVLLSLAIGDLNGDQKPDLLAGHYNGDLYFYKNIGTTSTWAFTTPVKNYQGIQVRETSSPQIIDLDQDGLPDLVIGEKDGKFNYYRNTGSAANPAFMLIDDTLGNFIVNEFNYNQNPPGYMQTGNAAGEIVDLDNDGKPEFVFGGEEGKIRLMRFNSFLQTQYYEDTAILFDSATLRYNTVDFGSRTRPAVGDLDGDGIKDILVGNERGGLHFLKGDVKISSVNPIAKRVGATVFPNPVRDGLINIQKHETAACRYTLYDMNGKKLAEDTAPSGTLTHKWYVPNLSQGIYTLQMHDGNHMDGFIRISVMTP